MRSSPIGLHCFRIHRCFRLVAAICFFLISLYCVGIALNPTDIDYLSSSQRRHESFDDGVADVDAARQTVKNVVEKQPDFMETQISIHQARVRHLRNSCETRYSILQRGPIAMVTQQHIYVNHRIKAIYCYIPKVACSNWKRVMMVLNGYPKEIEDITGPEAHERNGLTLLSSLPEYKQAHVLANYTKFMIAREPFLRLISAYTNKFEQDFDRPTNTVFQRFAKMIMKNHRRNASRVDIKTGRGVRWDEFVSYLTDPSQLPKFEGHWQEMYKLCSPCKINYNYIVKLETIKEDSDFILKSLNVSHLVEFPAADVQNSKTSNSSSKYQEYYNKLTPLQIDKLWNIYKTDFELFDYPKPDLMLT